MKTKANIAIDIYSSIIPQGMGSNNENVASFKEVRLKKARDNFMWIFFILYIMWKFVLYCVV